MKTNPSQPHHRIEAETLGSHPDFERGPRRAVLILLGTTAAFIVLLFAWMSFARLDISVTAMGAVIPSSRVQQIQSMEGGILQALKVREGAVVKKGEVLASVQNLQFYAEQGEAQQGLFSLKIVGQRARLDEVCRDSAKGRQVMGGICHGHFHIKSVAERLNLKNPVDKMPVDNGDSVDRLACPFSVMFFVDENEKL